MRQLCLCCASFLSLAHTHNMMDVTLASSINLTVGVACLIAISVLLAQHDARICFSEGNGVYSSMDLISPVPPLRRGTPAVVMCLKTEQKNAILSFLLAACLLQIMCTFSALCCRPCVTKMFPMYCTLQICWLLMYIFVYVICCLFGYFLLHLVSYIFTVLCLTLYIAFFSLFYCNSFPTSPS